LLIARKIGGCLAAWSDWSNAMIPGFALNPGYAFSPGYDLKNFLAP
jgi:hypothetical protein